MIFVDSINDLTYYTNPVPQGMNCYCETIIFPSDMILQAPLDWNGTGNYTIAVEVYSADGLTFLEGATSYFRYYFFTNPTTGRDTFTLQLNSFSPAMCNNKCYILHVVVGDNGADIFNKWTEVYCQNDCCDYPRGIIFSQDSIEITDTPSITPSAPKVTSCGETFITLRTYNDCYDAQTGKYYGIPATTILGDPFVYHDLTNFQGVIQQVPREIERTYSFNCRLQRVQSTRLYEMKSIKTAFPSWKMNEIENQLHAQNIYVEDIRYEFNGGSVFNRVQIPSSCQYVFNIVTTLNDCNIFQIHGCGTSCPTGTTTNMSFIVPFGANTFYNDSKVLIGDQSALETYFTNLPNVVSVTVLDSMDYDCTFTYGITVETNGFVPNTIYNDGTGQANRIYSLTDAQLADVCNFIAVPCGQVTIGIITIASVTCDTVTIGTITVEDIPETIIDLTPINNWVDGGNTEATIANGVVRLTLDISNTNYPALSSPFTLPGINDIVALLGVDGRPNVNISLPFDNFAIAITTEGNVIYQGYPTGGDETASTINITITYNNG